ncbi:MAG: hypothetical protein Q9195_000258 [Heterodermia aff. obscurata]
MASRLAKNFTLPTLLLFGACLQSLLTLVLPFRYALLPAFTLLAGQVINTVLISKGYVKNPYMKDARLGKYTAQIPHADGTVSQQASDKGVVVFLIGAVSHGPQGIFDPNFRKVGDFFQNMFVGIEADAAKWGYLGTGYDTLDLDSSNSLSALHVSYWQSIEQLHAFAQSPAHREGWAWWDEYRKQHNEVGIYHETYFSPANHWETIYENCMPIGLGRISHPGSSGEKGGGSGGMGSGLVQARDVKYRGMASRMGRTSISG